MHPPRSQGVQDKCIVLSYQLCKAADLMKIYQAHTYIFELVALLQESMDSGLFPLDVRLQTSLADMCEIKRDFEAVGGMSVVIQFEDEDQVRNPPLIHSCIHSFIHWRAGGV